MNHCITSRNLNSAIFCFGYSRLSYFGKLLELQVIFIGTMGVINVNEHFRHRRNQGMIENYGTDQ